MTISDELKEEIAYMEPQSLMTLINYIQKKLGIAGVWVSQGDARDAWENEYPDHAWDDNIWASIRLSQEWINFAENDELMDKVGDRMITIIRLIGEDYGLKSQNAVDLQLAD